MVIKANELTEGRVEKISLVDRGAIRQPFKIMKREVKGAARTAQKGETGMPTVLKGVFKRADAKPAAKKVSKSEPRVVAALVAGDAVDKEMLQRLKAAGLRTDDRLDVEIDDEEIVIFRQDGCPDDFTEDHLVVKSDEDVAVVCENVQKGLLSLPQTGSESELADNFTQSSIIPGISTALDSIACQVWKGIYGADSPGAAAACIDAVFGEASNYLKSLVGAIPVAAFKTDRVFKAGGGKLTFEFSTENSGGVIRFPMEPDSRDQNSGAASTGGQRGHLRAEHSNVDPTGGGDVDGDDEAVEARVGRGGSIAKTEKNSKNSKVAKGDDDTTGSAADGDDTGADNEDTGEAKPAAKKKAEPGKTAVERMKDESRPAGALLDMGATAVRKGPDGAGGPGDGTFTSRGMRPSRNGQADDADLAIDKARNAASGVTTAKKDGKPAAKTAAKAEPTLADVMGAITALKGDVESVAEAVEDQGARLGVVEKSAAKTRAKLARQVIADADGDSDEAEVDVRKSGVDAFVPLRDTAMDRSFLE
jgi:hypothetical protein